MQCPICNVDLSPLDVTSRAEHVNLCIENGPSTLDLNEEGRLVIKKTIDPKKIRKICPICDKTFQNLQSHFKTCAIKHDVPPSLMLDHWETINKDKGKPKKFPRELLDAFVTKCLKEGRIGEQLDFARALSLSLAEGEPETGHIIAITETDSNLSSAMRDDSTSIDLTTEISSSKENSRHLTGQSDQLNAQKVLIQKGIPSTGRDASKSKSKTYRLESTDDDTKRAYVDLRVERELSASRSKRYHQALASSRLRNIENSDSETDDVIITQEFGVSPPERYSEDVGLTGTTRDKLFHRARLKICIESKGCFDGDCKEHDLILLLDEFKAYSGASMDAAPKGAKELHVRDGKQEKGEKGEDMQEEDEAKLVFEQGSSL